MTFFNTHKILVARIFSALTIFIFVLGSPSTTLGAGFTDTYGWDTEGQTQPDGVGFTSSSFAMDKNGSNFLFGLVGGRLYISTNSGTGWTETQPAGDVSKDWYMVASDDDGSVLIAGAYGGRLYISTNSGTSWTETQPAGDVDANWLSAASDADGSNLIVLTETNRLYISTNSGTSWSETRPAGDVDRLWDAVASDADGSVLIVGDVTNGAGTGRLYISTNSGTSWTETQPAGDVDTNWYSAASDADGSNLIAANGSETYVSSDGGATWTPVGVLAKSVSSDADGSTLVAANSSIGLNLGRVYVSTDSGSTWNETRPNGATDNRWSNVSLDSDGSHLVALRAVLAFFNTQVLHFGLALPYVSTFSPADNATSVATAANSTLTFSETVTPGAGNITIYKASDDSVITTIDVSSGQVTGSGTNTITINPTADLDESTEFYVLADAGTFIGDDTTFSFVGIDDATSWSFTTADETAPAISSLSPVDDAANVEIDTHFTITFNEDVATSTGNITLKKVDDSSTVETFSVSSDRITTSGARAFVINPTADLGYDTEYYITIDATAIDDTSGNSYTGISDATVWNMGTISDTQFSSGGSGGNRKTSSSTIDTNALILQLQERLIELLKQLIVELMKGR